MLIWIVFIGIAIISYLVQANLKSKFEKYSQMPLTNGMTGKEVAEKMLRDDVAKFESGVSSLITAPTTQGQFDAMVSLAYNIGLGNFGKSTLLKKHNARCYTCAADQFRVWNRANGKVMNGLTKRRAAEREVYMG